MFAGLERIMARMSEIEERINQIAGTASPPAPPAASFAQTLQQVQGQPGLSGSDPQALPALPIAPDGQIVRPLAPPKPMTTSQLAPLVQQSAGKYGLDPKLVSAVIQAESGGNPRAVSSAGAMGLMQLMPASAADADVSDPFDPAQNIDAGAHKLSGLLGEFGGNLNLALAAYNAGAGAVRKYGGVPPYPETQTYIQRVRSLIEEGE